jgi:CRISPR/Cas system-associated exonuclease Cas4 (RecB family)
MLTKSNLLSYRQCPRKLWLEKHRSDLLPAKTYNRRVMDGEKVEELAHQILGGEAQVTFVRDGVSVRVDALVPEGERFAIRETKASTKAQPHYIEDVAIQAWVAESNGKFNKRVELNLLDNDWKYQGDGNYRGMFRQVDVTEAVDAIKADVPKWIEGAKRAIEGDMPAAIVGDQCKENPYDCPLIDFCMSLELPRHEHPIELLPGAGKKLARKLRKEKGYVSILEPQPEEFSGKGRELYLRMQQAHREAREILDTKVHEVMSRFPYPRYFLDFEAIDLPIPRWKGTWPYQHIPFQWSCHTESSPGTFRHEEFLDLSGNDPSRACAEQLLGVLGMEGPIFVYSATYERERLVELAESLPDLAAPLRALVERLVDLRPLVRDHFYHPAMRGYFSIKDVLPVIAPELRYENLIEVTDGGAAQVVYLQCVFEDLPAERRKEIEEHLRKYCRQDTWAMVEVAHRLQGRARPQRPPEG